MSRPVGFYYVCDVRECPSTIFTQEANGPSAWVELRASKDSQMWDICTRHDDTSLADLLMSVEYPTRPTL